MYIATLLPEIYYLAVILFFFILSLKEKADDNIQKTALLLSAAGVVVTALSINQSGIFFCGAYQVDVFSQIFKLLISIGFFLVVILGGNIGGVNERLKSEYFMFLTASVFGLSLLVSSIELLTIFVALEISSYSLYIVVPFRRGDNYRQQTEAGMKYLLFGAAASGIMLFGMSYLYGFGHSTYLSDLMQKLPLLINEPVVVAALVMFLCGFFFKLALFPLHFWTPDVYEGAANETSAFVATLPKLAAVALLIRLTGLAGSDSHVLVNILILFAVFSMTFGNLAALVQKDIKRLLAYSSIAHAGYVIIGILCLNVYGYSAAIYYIGGYLIMNIACFLVVYRLGVNGKNVTLDDLKGLYSRAPLLAFTLAVGAFALAGIPPSIGFTGKFFIFTAALQNQHLWVVIIAVINTAISIYYYLNMVRIAYSKEPEERQPITLSFNTRIFSLFLIIAIVLTGILPGTFIGIFRNAVKAVLPLY
jgi:NADH-quinone oxidoreductase subunit N